MTQARLDGRILVFAAQTFALGLFSGMLVIPASSLFLSTFGSARLPWTYIGGAVAALVGAPALAAAVRRWTLAAVAVPIWAGLSGVTVGAWALLQAADARWVSGPLLVIFPLGILIGFVLVGGQAGRVLDLREMKEGFPRVVMGLPAGFLVAGVLGDVLIGPAGGVEVLLLLAGGAGLAFLVLVIIARRRFPALGVVPTQPSRIGRLPLHRLFRSRYVVILLVYQMLSQLGTQLTDFLVFDRAAARYPDPDELGRFVARMTTVINVVDIVFLLAVAGVLLRRYGMRAGLSLNPAVVTALMAAAMVASIVTGMGATPVFLLIVGAKVLDISLNDGATRTALNTAYQAVEPAQRLPAQALIEGWGVPAAIGLTGIILLVLQQGLGMGPYGVTVLTVVVCLVWTAAATVVYRAYRRTLRDGLERRILDPAQLNLDDPDTREAVDRLLAEDDDRRVWAVLSNLGDHPDLAGRLARLSTSRDDQVAVAALAQLRALDPGQAVEVAAALVEEGSPALRLEALALLGTHGSDALPSMGPAIAGGMDDQDPQVRAAARRSAVAVADLDLVRRLVDELAQGRDRVAAMEALSTGGPMLAPLAAEALTVATPSDGAAVVRAVRLVRCLRAGPEVVAVLVPHLAHPVREVALEVRHALAGAGAVPPGQVDALLASDAGLAARVTTIITRLPVDPEVGVLRRSLEDELALAGRLALASLALDEDVMLIAGSTRRLGSGDPRDIAHAVEALELHLSPHRRRLVLPIIDRRLPPADRLAALRRVVSVPDLDLSGSLAWMVEDADGVWNRPWLAACAVHAARLLGVKVPERGRWDGDPIVVETRGSGAVGAEAGG